MSRKYKFKNPTAVYFISFATVYWIDVFTRQVYFSILAESIKHCRKEKGMEVFAYCFMPSHVHLIFRSDKEAPSGLLRDFKGFTISFRILYSNCFSFLFSFQLLILKAINIPITTSTISPMAYNRYLEILF